MARLPINIGQQVNDRTGDILRVAFDKTNKNFEELYSAVENIDVQIPTDLSEFNNDVGFVTANNIPSPTEVEYIELQDRFTLTEPVFFEKVVGVSEIDYIDEGLSITRDARTPETDGGGIYNLEEEEQWDALVSPVGLLWNTDGWGNFDDVKERQYVNLRQALKNRIGENITTTELVAHDTINDKYYKFQFTAWAQGAQHDGNFAYFRTLIDTTNQIGITFTDGTNQVTAPDRFRKYPQTYVGDTSAYQLVLEDAGKHVYAFGVTITIPSRNQVDFPIGSVIKIVAENQQVVLAPSSGVNISSATSIASENGSWTIPPNAIATLIKTRQGTDTRDDIWRLSVPQQNTSLPFLEVTNDPFITQSAILGTPVSFVRTAEGSETDAIDTGLTLARGAVGALYNTDLENEYDDDNHTSPLGTEWNSDGWGDLLNLSTRSYGTLRAVLNNAIGNNIVDAELVMHDTINNKYYKFDFSEWGGNNGGSFAYTRTQVADPNYFEKTDNGSEIDIIIPDDGNGSGVGITRGVNQGIFNPYREEGWNSEISPEGTLWNIDGWDDLSNVTSRTFLPFNSAYNGQLGNRVPNSRAVMYVPDNEKYYAIQWLNWTQNNAGGGFSYIRREIDLSKVNEGIIFADGSVIKTAEGLGRVKSTASNNRRIEEAVGSKTVSVTEKTTYNIDAVASRSVTNQGIIWLDSAVYPEIVEILNTPSDAGITDYSTIEFSIDNVNWYVWGGATSFSGTERGYSIPTTVTYNQGDTIYFRYLGGGAPVVWWNKNELPSGGTNFRGAVIDYHAYTGEATWIGSIHIVDDDGDENISHSEVSSGSTDSENDDLWFVDNEGTIKYRRIDGEPKTLKVHWTAKVFYGSETYD
jgi:hypothetical protein